MRTQLTDEQIRQYREQGFLVLPGFLDADEVARWRDVIEDAVRTRYEDAEGLTGERVDSDYYQKVFKQALKLSWIHDGARGLIRDPRIAEMAARLAGVDGLRLYSDQALFKGPHANPTAWHLDVPIFSFYSHDAVTVWVALDDATVENGCLWYVPGTHKLARFDANARLDMNVGTLFETYPEWKSMPTVPAIGPAGTAAIHNGMMAHGAGANMTPGSRRAVTFHFMPDGATYNGRKDLFSDDYVSRLRVGDVLDDEAQTPLVWRRQPVP